jgi:hypothetical protein
MSSSCDYESDDDFTSVSSDDDETSVSSASSVSTSDHKAAKPKQTRRRRVLEPKQNAPWQRMLDRAEAVDGASAPDSIDGRYFRRRFRIPFAMFKALIKTILDDAWFPGDFEADGQGKLCCVGIRGASLHVKVLSVLRVLGRGVCFDELYDGSGLSDSVLSTFYHRFLSAFCQRCQNLQCSE